MRRTTGNLLIDVLGFVGFVFLTATGVLVRYVLPPGSGRHRTIWGLDRHEWGSVHFWIAIVFFATLAFHLVFHWRWIIAMVRGRPREESGIRVGLGLLGAVTVAALAIAPIVSPVERGESLVDDGHGHSPLTHEDSAIRGRMTLTEIENLTGVPASTILDRLNLPADLPRNVGVGQLAREHGFSVEDVRRIVREYAGEE